MAENIADSGRGKLGKGFESLFVEKSVFEPPAERPSDTVPVVEIVPNSFQPRTKFDPAALDELKASIKENGLIQPIVVRKREAGYEVVAGERRLRAVKDLGWIDVPVVIKDVSDNEMLALALIENIQREQLNPIDTARAYKKLLDQFGFRQEDLARRVGKDRSTVTNFLRLLNLPAEVQNNVETGKISFGHARALLSTEDSDMQKKICAQIIKENLSVRDIEKIFNKTTRKKREKKTQNVNVAAIEDELKMKFGTKVYVRQGRTKGKIVIEFFSPDDFHRILEIMKVK